MERTDYTTLRSIRGIGAVLIYIHHFGCDGPWAKSLGEYSVTLFFMLSGLVLAMAYNPESGMTPELDTRNFILKRIIKIYPVFLLSLVASSTIRKFSIKALPFDILLLQSWIPYREFYFTGNPVSWFLSTLFFCYFMFCPLMRAYNTNSHRFLRWFVAGLILYICIVIAMPEDHLDIIFVFPPLQLPAFIAGMMVWMTFRKHQATRISHTLASALQLAIIALTVMMIFTYPYVDLRWAVSSYWWPITSVMLYIILVTERFDTPVNRLLRLRPMQVIGNVSFVFYLFHTTVLSYYRLFLSTTGIVIPSVPAIIICLVPALAVSWVIHYYVELPVAARLKTYFSQRVKGFAVVR